MKNPFEVLKAKEQEIIRVKNEINALKIAARLLNEETNGVDQKADHRVVEMP
ncbi:MAG TPA: hypothetical protein VFA74_01025 [Terriglobales bacterium]|nr:hypothetical protein [Terriglobales bacterium]